MKKAVIYCRVNTTNEDDKLSLEAQEADCRQYLEELSGYEVVEIVSDVQELGNPYRAGIGKLITMAGEKQLNAICMDRIERLGHDSDSTTLLIADLADLDAEVLFINDANNANNYSDSDGGNNTVNTNAPST
ncbi:MAG: recombinase family protein [Chloroflexia bacterium]